MINIINGRVIHIHIALRDQKNALVFLHGLIERRNGFLRPASKCRTICGKTISPRSGSIGRLTGSVYFFFGLANAYFLLYPPCFRKISRRHAVIIHEVVFFCNRSRMTKCFLAKTVTSTILEKNLHLEPFLIAVCLPQPHVMGKYG